MALCAAMMMSLSEPVRAHPHIFVDAGSDFLFDEAGRLAALRISWRYDEFATLFMFDVLDLDTDGDGRLDDADRAAIVAGETDWPPDYEGDVYLDVAGAKRALTRPENAVAEMVDDRIIVHFDLPLADPVDMSGIRATLRLYDPSYYYAYSATDTPRLVNEPPGCAATIVPFVPDDAAAKAQAQLAALSREETPSQPNIGRLFSDEIVLSCE